MADDRLEWKDLKVPLLWILVALIGAAVAWKYFFVAFPEASVNFDVSRGEALERARRFLNAEGYRLENYRSTIIFEVDDTAKTYLEREVGLDQANRLMASEVNVWYWKARLFRPLQKEEFSVHISPAGRLVGMEHIIEEGREGARLDEAAARALAEKFLRDGARVNLAAYDFLPAEANPTERPKRRDWSFTWERHAFRAKDAPYRLRVGVQGDHIGGYSEFLKVPEAWQRDFQRLRSSNEFYQSAAQVLFAFLLGAVVVVLFRLGRRGLLRWSGALKLALVLAVLFFLQAVNEWPLTRAGYDTNSSYTGFLASHLVLAALGAMLTGLSVGLTVAAGEPLYRQDFPEKLRLGTVVRLDGLRSKPFFRSCVIGLAMAAAHIGFVVAFYVVGRRFGFWVPQDIKYTNAVSTALPWISPLAIGFYAATNEEFLFRLFAIPCLTRLTESRIVAVVLPAFIWGFLHSAYPVEPGYARGLEVGLIGIVAGWVMLRWGILTTLVWHYTVDALLIGMFLLRSHSLYFRVSGALVAAFVLLPLAFAGLSLAVRGRFTAGETLTNRAEPLIERAAESVAAPRPTSQYEAASRARLRIAVAAGAIGLLLAIAVKPKAIGDFLRVAVDARQAATRTDLVLHQRGVDPSRFFKATTFVATADPIASEYLRRQVGVDGANRVFEQEVPLAFWRVRYFQPLQKEEYHVLLEPDGSLHAVRHLLDENAPGANLSKEEAQALAERYLRREKKADLAPWGLVESNSEERPARTDHTFVWEKRQGVGEAHARQEVDILGNEVAGYRVFLHIPDEWRRQQTTETLPRIVYQVGRTLFLAAWGVGMLVLFFKNLRQLGGAGVPWRQLARWALVGALGMALLFVTMPQVLMASYKTEMPFGTFLAILGMGLFLAVATLFSGFVLLFGLAWFFLSRVFGEGRLPGWCGMAAAYYRDAFWLGLGGTGILLGLGRLPVLVGRLWPTTPRSLEVAVPKLVDFLLPGGAAVFTTVAVSLFLVGALGLGVGFLAGYLPSTWLKASFLLLVALALVGSWGSPADLAKNLLLQVIFVSVISWVVVGLFRFNLLAYFVVIAAASLSHGAGELLQQPNGFFRSNGYLVVAAIIALFAWPLLAWHRGSRVGESEELPQEGEVG